MERILGLDVGTKTIGIAVSDPLGITAQPVTTIRRTAMQADLQELQGLIDLYNASLLVVGYPRNMNGSVGDQARFVERFVEAVREACPVPIELVDERLTTRIAQQAMIMGNVKAERRRQIIDQQAAAVILQGYLDRQSRLKKE
ncbi:MAG TPA: Holliday junction resolvase RuvX [Oscillatoriaceae cyanobacterium]